MVVSRCVAYVHYTLVRRGRSARHTLVWPGAAWGGGRGRAWGGGIKLSCVGGVCVGGWWDVERGEARGGVGAAHAAAHGAQARARRQGTRDRARQAREGSAGSAHHPIHGDLGGRGMGVAGHHPLFSPRLPLSPRSPSSSAPSTPRGWPLPRPPHRRCGLQPPTADGRGVRVGVGCNSRAGGVTVSA